MIQGEYIKELYNSQYSDFYRRYWGMLPKCVADIPVLTFGILSRVSLEDRYFRSKTHYISPLVKIVERGDEIALIASSYLDSSHKDFKISKNTPVFVLFSDFQDGIEVSLWCHANGLLPFIGCTNTLKPDSLSSDFFCCTTLVCDSSSLKRLLDNECLPNSITDIVIMDSVFSQLDALNLRDSTYVVTLFLKLPETGIIGVLHKSANMGGGVYKLVQSLGTNIECCEGVCVITKLNLATPLVRYKTGINCIYYNEAIYITS